mgnify:CR=1 FL=1
MPNLFAQLSFATKLLSNLFIADFFDVLIIAMLIYFIIFLFKQTRSFYVAAGFGIIIALYPIAQTFGLYLTSIVFQAFWGVFFIALVVIFQEELRRFFEQLAIWSTRQIKGGTQTTGSSSVKDILDAVGKMAMDKIGALIVMQGHDPVTKYINGGRVLDGVVSEELLLSLFDPASIGHDGALVISGNRAAIFGGHLPLSHDFAQIGKRGTRHSAALGLSEVSDAFVIVVSEERGEVSYVHKGILKTLKKSKDLSEPLSQFLSETFPKQSYTTAEGLIKYNSPEKLLSLSLAVVFWFFFSFQAATTQREFTVPITYQNIGENILIESTYPETSTITLEARGLHAFDLLDTKSLSVVIDASKLITGSQDIVVTDKEIAIPRNFSVVNIDPREINIIARPVKSIEMRVVPNIIKNLLPGYDIVRININPEVVDVLVPETYNGKTTLSTEAIIIRGNKSTSTISKLIIPNGLRLKNTSEGIIDVNLDIDIK